LSIGYLNISNSTAVKIKNAVITGIIYSWDSIIDLDSIKMDLVTNTSNILAITSESRYMPAKLTVRNSDISINGELVPFTGNSYIGITGFGPQSEVEVDSTRITVKSGINPGYGLYVYAGPTSVSNSKITVTSTQPTAAGLEILGSPTKIYNSYVDAPMLNYQGLGFLKCANTFNANLENICPAP
jgi:hypothetical protein